MEEISGSLKGRFVDDDDIVRTGRAMIEVNGWDFLHVPIPVGLSGKLKSFESAMDSRLVKSREDAEAAASSASDAAGSAEEARGSASAAEGAAGRASGSESAASESESAARGHAETAEGHAAAAGEQVSLARGQAEEAKGHASTAEGHASRAQSSAEESGRAADRAEDARSEARAAWDGAKEARDAAEGHASTAEGHATKAASSANDAQGAAGRADTSAQQVREIAESTRWDGDQVTVNGKQSPHLTGPRGPQGPPGRAENINLDQYARLDDLDERFAAYKPKTTNIIGDKEKPGVPIASGSNGFLAIAGNISMLKDSKIFLNSPSNIRAMNPPESDNDVANKQYVDGKADGKQDKSVVLDALSRTAEGRSPTTTTIGGFGRFIPARKVVFTGNDGWVTVDGNPEMETHVVNKAYVDTQVGAVRDRVGALESRIQLVTALPDNPDPQTLYLVGE